tara:strand:- start:64 stop:423 length:360 start_codon:yes stop_codon:yes gene_type:complete
MEQTLITGIKMYEYRAKVRGVYDADTITVDIDLGFGIIYTGQKLRLLGIDAPEVRGKERPEGLKSRDALRAKILDKDIIIRTSKDKKGKYGRWLATIILDDVNLNEWLINEGYAKEYGK